MCQGRTSRRLPKLGHRDGSTRALNPVTPPPQRPDPNAPPPEQPRSRGRTLVRALAILGVVVVVLIGGFYLTRYLVLRQYFVSVSKTGEIGIFQGVRGSFLGVSLNREIEGSCPPNAPSPRRSRCRAPNRCCRPSRRSGPRCRRWW